MAYSIDADGHLDLSPCYHGFGCDMMLASQISHEYFFSELQDLVAWDGTPVKGLNHEGTWVKLVAKHLARRKPFNPINDLDLNRVVRLPVLKRTVEGRIAADVFKQTYKKDTSAIQVVISGPDCDYVVVLGVIKGFYVLRSAYLGDAAYTRKIRERGGMIDKIRP